MQTTSTIFKPTRAVARSLRTIISKRASYLPDSPGGCALKDDWGALIRQVKEANDIVDVVSGYVALRQAGNTFKGLCPFHDDHRPSFDVDPNRQRYRCWSCGKYGDVFTFIQEQDHAEFREAVELLAKRAGISLENRKFTRQDNSRALMLEVVRWAETQYQHCLLETMAGEAARHYLGERKLNGETVRKFGLGFAPAVGDWLVRKAQAAGTSFKMLEEVGLIARRDEGKGFYDRFRDRVIFPIRDIRGKTVGFGGRIMPNSPYVNRAPKYYNSCDTPLFSKSDLLYGLDQARHAVEKNGFLAIVEGYTDVLMAQQMGVGNVAATMGTALNARHVQQLRRVTGDVVLVFDADAGGTTGVDRALELFVSQNVSLRVATLPEGLDPCDFLDRFGAEEFRSALTNAKDVLEFKLNQVLHTTGNNGVEGRRRAIDSVLRIIAVGSPMSGQADQLKRELMISRIAQQFGTREETLWQRLKELRREQKPSANTPSSSSKSSESESTPIRRAPAQPHEKQLLEVLLAEPTLVEVAEKELDAGRIEHPGLRKLVEELYQMRQEGLEPTLDELRARIENPALMSKALELQEIGLASKERRLWLDKILQCFRQRQEMTIKQDLQNKLKETSDPDAAAEILRQLQERKN